MGYGCGDSFPFDFDPNGNPFGSKSKGKLSPQPYPIRFERKWKYSFLSVFCVLPKDINMRCGTAVFCGNEVWVRCFVWE